MGASVVPAGLDSLPSELTRDLRPGLYYAASVGAGMFLGADSEMTIGRADSFRYFRMLTGFVGRGVSHVRFSDVVGRAGLCPAGQPGAAVSTWASLGYVVSSAMAWISTPVDDASD